MPTAQEQSPSVADLENNLAFIKLDKVHTQIGSAFGMHYISTVNVGGTIYAYFIRWYDAGRKKVCDDRPGELCPLLVGGVALATSTGGLDFVYEGLVLPAGAETEWDGTYATFPGVWYEAGIFYLVYEGKGLVFEGKCSPVCEGKRRVSEGQIGLAISRDGRNFVKQGIILSNDKTDKNWESTNIGTPSLYRENGQWYLFYHGFDGETCQIGVASGPELDGLQKYSGNPIIPSCRDTWQSGTAGRRDVTKINGKYYMVYEGSGPQPYEKAKWSSGVAASDDLEHWTLFSQNAVLPENQAFGNDGPNFLSVGGKNYFYYRRGGNTRRAMFANDKVGGYDLRWEMNSPDIYHEVGQPYPPGAWYVDVEENKGRKAFMQFGPYTTDIPEGDNIATWQIMIDNNTADNFDVLRLEVVVDVHEVIAWRCVKRQQFKRKFCYEYFSLPFSLDPGKVGKKIELRALWLGSSYIRMCSVGVS